MNSGKNRTLLLIAAVFTFTFAFASVASAATITFSGGLVRYSAANNETNNVSVTYNGVSYTFTDSSASITAGTGCTKAGSIITCPYSKYLWVVTGNLEDIVTFTNATPSEVRPYVSTGEGSDFVDASPVTGGSELQMGGGEYNTAYGGSGDDVMVLNESLNASDAYGQGGNDYIYLGGSDEHDIVNQTGGSAAYGGDGNDQLWSAEVTGGAFINGEGDDDTVIGGEGLDHVMLSDGQDTVDTYGGNDDLEAVPNTTGGDVVHAGDGNDRLTVWPLTPAVDYDGGDGVDNYTQFYSSTAPFRITMDNVANDGGPSDAGDNVRTSVENVIPRSSNTHQSHDYVVGSSADNTLHGGSGNDHISGQGGADTLNGGSGNDWIEAVDGTVDTITCGSGSDTVQADTDDTVTGDCEAVSRF
ncbi:MAG: calcium-binding protein [Thermoleophilaceae bacterium]|nr:calcium-binding protein [Thermoleophilaceae bacterium]